SMVFQLCIPPQQISPSAAKRSPYSAAASHALRKVSAINLVFSVGFFAHSSTLLAESTRITLLVRIPSFLSLYPKSAAFLTTSTKRSLSACEPIAEPPSGGQIGATSVPIARP